MSLDQSMIAVGVVASVGLVGAGWIDPAHADHDDEVGWGWGADDRHMEWWFDTSGSNSLNGAQWGANNLDRSNLDMFREDSWTDIRVTRNQLEPGVWGVGGCDTYWTGNPIGRCDKEFVRFNWNAETQLNVSQWKWLGCHEFGHAGGIYHRNPNHGTCLIPTLADLRNADQAFLDDHDLDAINSDIRGMNQWG